MEQQYQKCKEERQIMTETETEYLFPDYLGDVRRILHENAHIVDSGSFLGSGEVNFVGTVCYEVFYVDAEGKLSHLMFSSDYENRVPMEVGAEDVLQSESRVNGYSIRLLGPRRISAKAQVETDVCLRANTVLTYAGTAFEKEEKLQTKKTVLPTEERRVSDSVLRNYEEEIEVLENTDADGVQILSSGGVVHITDTRVTNSGILVSGRMELRVLLSTDTQPPFAVGKSVPFEELIPLDLTGSELGAAAKATVASVKAECDNREGVGAAVRASVEVALVGEVEENKPVAVISDAYLLGTPTETRYGEFKSEESLAVLSVSVPVETTLSREDVRCKNPHAVLYAEVTPKNVTAENRNGNAVLRADALFSGFLSDVNENGETEYLPFRTTAPLEIPLPAAGKLPEDAHLEVRLYPATAQGELDLENIRVAGECNLTLRVTRPVIAGAVLSSEACEEEEPAAQHCINVCYPIKGETLWDIAKTYRRDAKDIAKDNELTEEVALGMSTALPDFLFIGE